jgi:hypothetical protein
MRLEIGVGHLNHFFVLGGLTWEEEKSLDVLDFAEKRFSTASGTQRLVTNRQCCDYSV